jgi:hypothetical protein
MDTYDQIEKLLAAQIATDTEKLLTQVRPQVVELIQAEAKDAIDYFLAQRVDKRIVAMRTAAEQKARASILDTLIQPQLQDTDNGAAIEVPAGEPLDAAMVQTILSQALDPITAARGIKKAGKKWACAYCDKAYTSERGASIHSKSCPKKGNGLSATQPQAADKKTDKRLGKKAEKRQCIKPDCTAPSKGPRFRYLCVDHRTAPERSVLAWQRRWREERDDG